jgi:replicative DNA helicase
MSIELKTPPHSLDAEQALIGGILLRPESLLDLEIPAEAFYVRQHRLIWTAILTLHDARQPIDAVSLSDALHNTGSLADAGGMDYLASFVENIHSAANVQHYATIVRDKASERRLISAGHSIAEMGYNADGRTVADRVTVAQGYLADLDAPVGDDAHSVGDCLRETINALQEQWKQPGGILGLRTGFVDLDKRTQGLRDGDMIVIAGRPSQGKTTLAMNIAENVALHDGFVIVFSLEMPRHSLMQRMLASVAKVDFERLQNGSLAHDEIDRVTIAGSKLRDKTLFIDDSTRLTSNHLLSRARRIARRMNRKPNLIVVDYLQLLQDKGEGNARVEVISRNMKSLAREIGCPALILSQLNRGVEARADKRPLMSDLRDSGSIEQDADLILMMYRDEYYDEQSAHKGLAEVICRKYRNGKVGTDILSSSLLSQCRFEDSVVRHIERVQPMKRKAGGFKHYAD